MALFELKWQHCLLVGEHANTITFSRILVPVFLQLAVRKVGVYDVQGERSACVFTFLLTFVLNITVVPLNFVHDVYTHE